MRVQLEQTPQKSGSPSDLRGVEAVDRLRQHQRELVFARAARPGEDQRVGKAARANAFTQMRDGGRVAEKFAEAHGLRIEHRAP